MVAVLTLVGCNKDRFEEIEGDIIALEQDGLYKDATIAELRDQIIALTSEQCCINCS